jgi:hypothetical protein
MRRGRGVREASVRTVSTRKRARSPQIRSSMSSWKPEPAPLWLLSQRGDYAWHSRIPYVDHRATNRMLLCKFGMMPRGLAVPLWTVGASVAGRITHGSTAVFPMQSRCTPSLAGTSTTPLLRNFAFENVHKSTSRSQPRATLARQRLPSRLEP